MRDSGSNPSTPPAPVDSSKARPLPVRELLGKEGQLRLEHDGAIYLLRITRNGKLILTK